MANYNLIYTNKDGKKLETIVTNKGFGLCVSLKIKKQNTNNYKLGILKIVKNN